MSNHCYAPNDKDEQCNTKQPAKMAGSMKLEQIRVVAVCEFALDQPNTFHSIGSVPPALRAVQR